jgi:hypothetical protein
MPKYAARVDANQPAIVEALRAIGASVLHLHTLGQGAPDILVGYRGRNYLMEIKDGNKPPSRRRLTDDERIFFDGWLGQVAIVENEQQAIDIVTGDSNE